jgi:hypothetical protein
MALAPIDYGPQVQADTQGLQAQMQAVREHEAVFQEVRQLGANVEGGAQAITHGILQVQAAKATADVKEKQAQTLEFIDNNKYVSFDDLRKKMTPEDFSAWHAKLPAEYHSDAEGGDQAVPMFTAAGALFDSAAKQARESASQIISLPGWRTGWQASEQTESATIRERYVNRIAADQMIADQRAQVLTAADRMVDSAFRKEDFDTAVAVLQTNKFLSPAERRVKTEEVLAKKDSFDALTAMTKGDVATMGVELAKLKGPNAAAEFPNLSPRQRLTLEQQLTREHGAVAAKNIATRIVNDLTNSNGKLDNTTLDQTMVEYKEAEHDGVPKADVLRAVETQRREVQAAFDAKQTEIAHQLQTVAQKDSKGNPAPFSLNRILQNGETRKAFAQLNEDAPQIAEALMLKDHRQEVIAATKDRNEQHRLKQIETLRSKTEGDRILHAIDHGDYKDAPPTKIMEDALLAGLDRADTSRVIAWQQKLAAAGGKLEESVSSVINKEILAAYPNDKTKRAQAYSKYGKDLLEAAHDFIRANPELPKDKMDEGLRKAVSDKLLSGKVVGSRTFFPDTSTARVKWEQGTDPNYVGKDFVLPDGTVLKAKDYQKAPPDQQFKKTGYVLMKGPDPTDPSKMVEKRIASENVDLAVKAGWKRK